MTTTNKTADFTAEEIAAAEEAVCAELVALREENARLKAGRGATNKTAEQRAQQGWRDISTAPKDGTAVLLYFPKRYQGKGGISWGCFVNGDWLDSRAIRDNDATHWMHLPSAPNTDTVTTATDAIAYVKTRLAQIASGDYKACGHTAEEVAADALKAIEAEIGDAG